MAHTVIAVYRPKPDSADALRDLIRTHVPRLRALGLATDAPVTLLRSPEDGTFLEIFDWRDEAAVATAHEHPEVLKMWEEFGALCEFAPLADLAEATQLFPHFERGV
jgi:quinol monooxygenase YgiN